MKSKTTVKRSILSIFVLSIAAAAIFPTILVSFTAAAIIYRHFIVEIHTSVQALGNAVGHKTRDNLVDAESHLHLYAAMADRQVSESTLATAMEATAAIHPDITRAFMLTPEGYVRSSYPLDAAEAGMDLSGLMAQAPFPEDGGKGLSYSRAYLSPVDGSVSVSIYKTAENGSVALIELDLENLSRFLKPLRMTSTDSIAILDSAGRYIAHTDETYVREQRYESRFSSGMTGVQIFRDRAILWYASSMAIRETPWRVVYYRNIGEEIRVLGNIFLILAITAILILVGILLLSLRLRKSAEQIFREFIGGIEEVAAGRYEGELKARFQEFESLSSSVAAMASAVRAREEDLRSSIHERDALLREVYHRVNNNLQLIMSLLNLEMQDVGNPEQAIPLKLTMDRVGTIALVHEILYTQNRLGSVRLDEYLSLLVSSIASRDERTVRAVETDLSPVSIPPDSVVPCALLAHELLVNALDHGIAGRSQGHVRIRLREDNSMVELKVSDDGPGFPLGFDPSASGRLGFTLIRGLAIQLGGTLSWDTGINSEGVGATLRFPQN